MASKAMPRKDGFDIDANSIINITKLVKRYFINKLSGLKKKNKGPLRSKLTN